MKPDDTLRQLEQVDPAPRELVEGAARRPAARAVLDRILEAPAPAPSQRAPRRAPLGIAAGIVAILVAVSVAIVQRPQQVELPEVRVVLTRAAEAAAGAAEPQLAPGQYLYTRVEAVERFTATTDHQWTALLPVQREFWIAPDGSGRVREVPGTPTFPGARDRARWRADGKPRIQGTTSDRVVAPGSLVPDLGSEVSNDADRLAAGLLKTEIATELPESQRLFVAASDLLSKPLVDPTLRSSLFRLIAGLDGVELLGRVEDPNGRMGIAVGIRSRATGVLSRRVMIFDEATSVVLADKAVLLGEAEWIDATPPITVGSHVFGTTAVVSSDHARPGE